MGETILEIRDLTVDYAGLGAVAVRALDGFSLTVQAGECVGVLGESGSGKSTLALALLRLLPSNTLVRAGTLRFAGTDVTEASEQQLRRLRCAQIAIIFQQPGMALNPFMTILRQVTEVVRAHRGVTGKLARLEGMNALEQVLGAGTDRIARAYPHELSGGERQRVSIAQALACRARLIIADEATAALDTIVQAQILELLRNLKGTSAMILMTHDARILAGLTDRVVVLRRGRVEDERGLPGMYRDPRNLYTAGLLGAAWEAPGI